MKVMNRTSVFENLTYSERARLRVEDPDLYKALKESFERRAASEIRRGIRGWLHKLEDVDPGKHKRIVVLQLAAVADVDIRTATKAYEHGPDAIRGRVVRERVREVMTSLGLVQE